MDGGYYREFLIGMYIFSTVIFNLKKSVELITENNPSRYQKGTAIIA